MSEPILLDESLFDEAFIPERLLCRDGQIKEIARCLNPARSGKSIRNIFIYGKPGVGKTLMCKWILKEYFSKQSVFVNCWSNRTTHKVMHSILLQMGQVVHGRESASELVKRFQSLGRKIIVCLDESDHLKDAEVLYVLTRNGCGIVLISNQSLPVSNVDVRIKSSLLLNEIEFKPYTKDEILSILKERSLYGIRSGSIDNNLLAVISAMCNGDARVALQTLKISAKEAESRDREAIIIDDIKYALKCSRKYRSSYLLSKLNAHQKIVYEILKKNESMQSGDLFKEYCRQAREHLSDRGYRVHMEKMVELGLVKSKASGRWKVYEIIA